MKNGAPGPVQIKTQQQYVRRSIVGFIGKESAEPIWSTLRA